jgi:hypothetical protein
MSAERLPSGYNQRSYTEREAGDDEDESKAAASTHRRINSDMELNVS